MSPTIELFEKRQIKKGAKTLILDAVVLADLQIICISSVCCDLRFYDVSTGKCNLRLYVKGFPSQLYSLHYHESTSKLIAGDSVGSVRVLTLSKDFRRKLKNVGTSVIRQITYAELIKVRKLNSYRSCLE